MVQIEIVMRKADNKGTEAKLKVSHDDRTDYHPLKRHEYQADRLLAEPSVLNVIDSFPIELLLPIRQGRSAQQIGTKNRDKGRWSIGVKLCWILNRSGQVVGWHWLPTNHTDQDFLPLVDVLLADGLVLA